MNKNIKIIKGRLSHIKMELRCEETDNQLISDFVRKCEDELTKIDSKSHVKKLLISYEKYIDATAYEHEQTQKDNWIDKFLEIHCS